jgi:hypothetical protein
MLSPEAVVQRQLDAYNARNLDLLVATYAPDAEVFEHPATLLARGSDELRQRYAARLQEPNLHAKLLKRVVLGSTVIDHERVTRTFPEGSGTLELMMIYEVAGDRIAKAWAIAGPRQLDPKS